jgi:hypothetical protein
MTLRWRELVQRLVYGMCVGSALVAAPLCGSDVPQIPLYESGFIDDDLPAVVVEGEEFILNEDGMSPANGLDCLDDIGCGPNWTMQGGAVILRRLHANQYLLTDGTTPINLADMNFRYQSGPMLSATRHSVLGSCWDLQLTYFGVNNFDAVASSANVTNFATVPPFVPGAPVTATTNYTSRIDSTEVNMRRSMNDWFTGIVGFRWVELREDLNTDFVNASHAINTNNHMYGIQFGGEALFLDRGAFTASLFGKVGIYENSADQNTDMVNIPGAVASTFGAASKTAFIGDVGIFGHYLINDCWSIRGGYQVLFLDGVALASDQIFASNIINGTATVDVDNTAVYHGFFASIEKTW